MDPIFSGIEVARRTISAFTPPPPPPTGTVVTLGATSQVLNTLKGWTSVHSQTRDSVSKVAIGDCAEIQNQHLLGFGSAIDVEVQVTNMVLTSNVVTLTITTQTGWVVGHLIDVVGCGAPFDGTDLVITAVSATSVSYAKTVANVSSRSAPAGAVARNFHFFDSTFGYPTKATGYFSNSAYICLTMCSSPPYMRNVPAGGSPNPMGTPSGTNLTKLDAYFPPNWAYFPAYGALAAAMVARYPHLTHIQVWNENKGFYIGTQTSGSNIVPTGSGLVADTTLGGNNNRWWTEGHTAMYNQIYTQVKAVRNVHVTGPYCVLNSFVGMTNSADWSNDAFPLNYMGSWGYGDKKILAHLMYFIRYCSGADSLCVDIRNVQKDGTVSDYYDPVSVPATPDPTNVWLSNPEGGIHARYWSDGYENGAWVNGQRQIDFMTWLRALGASSSVYQRSVCDARTINVWYAEWYAYSNRPQFKKANPATGNYYTDTPSDENDETAAFAWQYIYSVITNSECAMAWKPEGTVQGNVVDPADSNPLALYKDNDPSTTGRTKLYTMCKDLKAHFPKGTQLYSFTSNNAKVWGLASASWIMLVSRDSQPLTLTLINPFNTTPPTVTLTGYQVLFLAR